MIALGGRTTVTKDWLCQELERFRSADDVFFDGFLHGVIFMGARDNAESQITPDARQMLESMGTNWIETPEAMNGREVPKPGPYLATQQDLLEIFRLYDDVQGAFMSSVILHGQA